MSPVVPAEVILNQPKLTMWDSPSKITRLPTQSTAACRHLGGAQQGQLAQRHVSSNKLPVVWSHCIFCYAAIATCYMWSATDWQWELLREQEGLLETSRLTGTRIQSNN